MEEIQFDPKLFLERVGEGRTITAYRAGEIIFKQGGVADRVLYLQSGQAKESVSSDSGKDAVIGILEAGFFFGTGILDGLRIRLSTVTAITPCIVTAITLDTMRATLMKEPLFSDLFMKYLLNHNSKVEAEKLDLLLNSSEKRLAQRLLILARVNEGPAQIIGPEITQEILAEMIGTTRPRVNYFLNRFRHLGLIQYNGGIKVLPGLVTLLGNKSAEPER